MKITKDRIIFIITVSIIVIILSSVTKYATNSGSSYSYRVSVAADGNIYWHYTGGFNNSCSKASGQIVYISAS